MDVKTTLFTHGLIAALALGAWPHSARAQGADQKAAAEVLFNDARRAMEAGNFATACPKLERSQQIDASVGTLGWLGRCYEKLGKTASAWANYRAAASLAQRRGDAERGALAAERASALEPTLSWLTIDATALAELASVEVLRNGVAIPRSDWGTKLPVDPGVQHLELRAPGYQSAELRVSIGSSAAHETARLPALVPEPAAATPEAPAAPQAPETPAPHAAPPPSPPPLPRDHPRTAPGTSGQAIAGYVVGGAGGVGLGLGLAFFLKRSSDLDARDAACPEAPAGDCPSETKRDEYESRQNDAKLASTVSTVSTIAGATLLVTGAVLWLTAPSATSRAEVAQRAERSKGSPKLQPIAWRDGGGLWLESTW